MIIDRLDIEHFMAIGHASLSLNDKGLVLLQGENTDDPSALSNGAGKSSIADAFMWCLTGETARKLSSDGVINREAKYCYVGMTLRDGAHLWQIDRYRKHPKHKSVLRLTHTGAEGTSADLTLGTNKLTQDKIYSVLGAERDVLLASVYAAQDGMVDLPAMADKSLKQIVEHAAGMERLATADELAKGELSDAKRALESAQQACESSRGTLVMAQSNMDTTLASQAQWIEERQNRRKKLEEELKPLYKQRDALDAEAARLVGAIGEKPTEMLDAMNEVHTLRKAISDQSQALLKHNEEAQRARHLAEEVQNSLKDVVTSQQLARNAIEAIEAEAADTCPHCKSAFDNSASKAERIAAHQQKLEALQKSHDGFSEKAVAAQESHAALLATMPVVSHDDSALQAAEERLAGLTAKREAYDARVAVHTKHTEIQSAILGKIHSLQSTVAAIVEDLDGPSPFALQIAQSEQQIKDFKQALFENEAHVAELTDALHVATDVAACLAAKGIRARVLDTVTPYLNERTSDYLATLSDDSLHAQWHTLDVKADGELRENFHIEIGGDSASESYAGLSGGEKRKVKLACCLALQDLIAERASQHISLFIADEIDDALDTAGLERLMQLLELRARERGTLLIISHNDLQDWVRQTTTVTKHGGVSTISGTLAIEPTTESKAA